MSRAPSVLISSLILVTMLSMLPSPADAQTQIPELNAALREHRMDIRVAGTEFAGPGARLLSDAVSGTQFVVMGEDHGIAESAWIACALFQTLQPLGYNTLAIEVGPYAARELSRVLAGDDPDAAMRAYVERYPFSIPFYTWREDFAFLSHAHKLSGSAFRLIGVDQELMGSSRLLLQKALDQAPNRALERRIKQLMKEEAERYQHAAETGDPSQLFMMTADAGSVRKLADDLRRAGTERAAPVDALLDSRAIYAEMMSDTPAGNARRGELMRHTLASQLSRGKDVSGDKVMIKVGAYHAFRGMGPLADKEIGALAFERAKSNGSRSLHILVLGAAGEQLSFAGIGQPAAREPFDMRSDDTGLPGARPLVDIALEHPRSWSIFDLRPIAADGRGSAMKRASEPVKQVLTGYDLAIIMPGVSSASEIP